MLQLFAFVLVAIPAAIASFQLESRRKQRVGGAQRPYAWGYFQGVSGLLMGFWAIVLAIIVAQSDSSAPGAAATWFLAACVWAPAGYFVVKRRRWAWIVHTVASLNPVWWIANFIYARNRWTELSGAGRQAVMVGKLILVIVGVGLAGVAVVLLHQVSERSHEDHNRRSVAISFLRDSVRRNGSIVKARSKTTDIDWSFLPTAVDHVAFRLCNAGSDTVLSMKFVPKTRRRDYSTEYNLATGKDNISGVLATDRTIAPKSCVTETWFEPFEFYDTVFANAQEVKTKRGG
jgi:hypothetical protein